MPLPGVRSFALPVPLDRPLRPPELLAALPPGPGRCLLESGLADHSLAGGAGAPAPGAARWSFAFAEPRQCLSGRERDLHLSGSGADRRWAADPLAALADLVAAHAAPAPPQGPPVGAAAAGYLAYEVAHQIERLPPPATADLDLPDLYVCFYDQVVALDHATGAVWVAGALRPGAEDATRARAQRRVSALQAVAAAAPGPPLAAAAETAESAKTARMGSTRRPGLAASLSRSAYLAAVERCLEYLRSGDIFQVNLARRFRAPLPPEWGPAPGWALYGRLRELAPAPFAAYLEGPDFAVASASPERFLLVEPGGRVESRPIKGTRPRGDTPAADAGLAAELLASAKDMAELVMIVDLMRNDLGRVCRTGSVQVPDLRRLERFPPVHHTVATVAGRLRPGVALDQILRATFPAGSITGAPKVRAMEIIRELEPVRRGVYTGAIGYFGSDGRIDLNVAIRTVTCCADQALFHAGGGIVADSDPAAEDQEVLAKGAALAAALGFHLEETTCTSG